MIEIGPYRLHRTPFAGAIGGALTLTGPFSIKVHLSVPDPLGTYSMLLTGPSYPVLSRPT